MLLESRFFNSENKDRVYFAEDFAEYFSSFVGNGVNPNNFENEMDFQGSKGVIIYITSFIDLTGAHSPFGVIV